MPIQNLQGQPDDHARRQIDDQRAVRKPDSQPIAYAGADQVPGHRPPVSYTHLDVYKRQDMPAIQWPRDTEIKRIAAGV